MITGVSTGIGYEASRFLVEKGYHVFGSVRKEADAEKTKNDFGDRFTPLIFDVTDEKGVQKAAEQVSDSVGSDGLAALVNNAGISVTGPLMHLSPDEIRFQLEVNVVGVFSVTQSFLPLLGAVKNPRHLPGRVVNISSVSGKIAYPFMGPYAASKHALEALSDSLRRELMLYGIDVILIEPGTVETPILEKTDISADRYQETDYGPVLEAAAPMLEERLKSGMPVEVVGRTIYEAITSTNPKVRYPLPNQWLLRWLLPRFLPARMIDKMAAKAFGLIRK